jgi:hypothetical protein
MNKTHWKVHPISSLFPVKTPEERAELKADMQDRAANGLDPLESEILLYDNMILDGRHRDEIWCELAEEGACKGFFARTQPPTATYSSKTHGNLGAWMRAKSRNMVVRHIPADQRAAVFLKAVESYPELKAVLDQIKEENTQRKKEGKPLAAGDRRGNTAKKVADLAGVGATTVKQVQKVQKESPEQFEEVAQGKTTVKKAISKIKEKKAPQSEKANSPSASFKVGDTIYQIEGYRPDVAGSPRLVKLVVKSIKKDVLVCGGVQVPKVEALGLDAAKQERKTRIGKLIADLQKALKTNPTIV